MALDGRVAVVTGGGRGMGREMVRGLLKEGAKVVILERSWDDTGLSNDNIEAWKAELKGYGSDVIPLTVDITDGAKLQEAYETTMKAFGTVDIIVNDAGLRMRDIEPSTGLKIMDSTIEQWRSMFEVNTFAPWRVIKTFIPPMIEKRSGSIVNVSTHAGGQPYNASKHAFTNLSEDLATELKEYNIAVNTIFPGGTMTTGYDEQNRLRAEKLGRAPSGPPMALKPTAIVRVVLHLAQQDASTETGTINPVLDWLLAHGMGPKEKWLAFE